MTLDSIPFLLESSCILHFHTLKIPISYIKNHKSFYICFHNIRILKIPRGKNNGLFSQIVTILVVVPEFFMFQFSLRASVSFPLKTLH